MNVSKIQSVMFANSKNVINWRPGFATCWLRVAQILRPASATMSPEIQVRICRMIVKRASSQQLKCAFSQQYMYIWSILTLTRYLNQQQYVLNQNNDILGFQCMNCYTSWYDTKDGVNICTNDRHIWQQVVQVIWFSKTVRKFLNLYKTRNTGNNRQG